MIVPPESVNVLDGLGSNVISDVREDDSDCNASRNARVPDWNFRIQTLRATQKPENVNANPATKVQNATNVNVSLTNTEPTAQRPAHASWKIL